MASGSQGPKQTRGYFVPLLDCRDKVYVYTPGSGAGGSFLPGSFSAGNTWCRANAVESAALSSLSSIGAGGLLRDMGKTVVSSNRTFRKVQLVTPSLAAGVTGASDTVSAFATGYIELATGNAYASAARGSVAPVAYMPGLL